MGCTAHSWELLKLGFAVAQSTVAKYMVRRADPFGQSWGTFLRNHAPHIAAMDLFVVPTIGFDCSTFWSLFGRLGVINVTGPVTLLPGRARFAIGRCRPGHSPSRRRSG